MRLHLLCCRRQFLEDPICAEVQSVRSGIYGFAGLEDDEPLATALMEHCGAAQLQLLCQGERRFAASDVRFEADDSAAATPAERQTTALYVQYCDKFSKDADADSRKLLVQFAKAICVADRQRGLAAMPQHVSLNGMHTTSQQLPLCA